METTGTQTLNASLITDNTASFYIPKITMHSAMLLVSLTFESLFIYLLLKSRCLRQKLRFILLVGILLSQIVLNVIQVNYYSIKMRNVHITRVWCALYFMLLYFSSYCEIYCVATMSVDRYVAICWALRYDEICSAERYAAIVLAIISVAAFTPLLKMILQMTLIRHEGDFETCSMNELDGPSLMGTAMKCLTLAPFMLSTVVIFVCYCLVYCKGKLNINMRPASNRARNTILYHSLQLSTYVVPIFVYYLTNAYVPMSSFSGNNLLLLLTIAFGVAQGLCPVVYGLRTDELRETLIRIFVTNRQVVNINRYN